MFQRGSFLLAAEDEIMAHTLRAPMQRYAVVRWTRELDTVSASLDSSEHWAGLVIDLDPVEQQALDFLSALRASNPLLPILAIASRPHPALMNGCHVLRVELVCKPLEPSNLISFVQRALVHSWLPDGRVAAFVDNLAQRNNLTSREVQLMAYALGDEPRKQVMRRLGITENTLKTQVRALLRKCGERSMDGLAKNVLRQALIEGAGTVVEEAPEQTEAVLEAQLTA
jgi:DNA-binding NarL/FixJ family response regulator